MITKIVPISQLKQIFFEIFLNKTNKVNDISQESVLNAFSFGVAKVGQKCLVNQAIVEGHIFPDTSYGIYLDELAKIRGVSPRFTAQGSSTYIRLVANQGTVYFSDITTLTSSSGVLFSLEEDVIIGVNGFAYAKIKSKTVGENANVDPLSVNKINPMPEGHIACTNEYRATGGRNDEDDALFRMRIKESVNQLARNTISYLEQIFMKINNNVLRLFKGSTGADGRFNLIVVSVNGQDFTQPEFDQILSQSEQFLTLGEILSFFTGYALNLSNPDWLPVDIQFRVDIDPAYDQEKVRREIQIQMGKLFDYRFWKYGDKIEWKNLLFAAKNVEGVRYVPDAHFSPHYDINVPNYRLPRIRGFVMRDLYGNIIEDNGGVLSQFYYPNEPDYSFQSSVLTTI